MTTRRKTWIGVGLFAIAGTAIPNAVSAAPASTGIPSARDAAHAPIPVGKLAPFMVAGGEEGGGGEGGEGALESYVLPTADPNAAPYDAKGEIAAYAEGARAS